MPKLARKQKTHHLLHLVDSMLDYLIHVADMQIVCSEHTFEGQSIWPVMLTLTSLPPALRMKCSLRQTSNASNLILAGIWLGPVKPKTKMLLDPVLEKLDVYGKKGIAISTDGGIKS